MQSDHILVCEQNADHAELLAYNLNKAGYLPTVIAPDNVVKHAVKFPPQMISLGRSLEDRENAKLSKKIKKKPELADTLIVCLTTNDSCDLTSKSSGAHIDVCLILPLKPKKIIKTINNLLGNSKSASTQKQKKKTEKS